MAYSNEQLLTRNSVRGAYEIQKLRISTGNRVVANYRVRLGQRPGEKATTELTKEELALLDQMVAAHKLITNAVVGEKVAERRRSVTPRNFRAEGIITAFVEYQLVTQYITLLESEEAAFKAVEASLAASPIYPWLESVKGCGVRMSGIIISEIDITEAKYPSSLWAYAGLDVAQDGRGRSRRREHLRDYTYNDKDTGEEKTRVGITFNPFLKTKLIGVLAETLIKARGHYAGIYRDYKTRLENNPTHQEKSKGHRHNMAKRYMIKMFLLDLYKEWRTVEKLPVHPPYHEAKLGLTHGKDVA